MNPTKIKQTLAARTIQLSKSLGQNFLHDDNQLRRIIDAAELTTRDQVLEIGPGLGALTQPLLDSGPRILAIEKDARLYDYLKIRLADAPGLALVRADALDYLRTAPRNWSDWKVVSNLPYSVASPILVELAQSVGAPERMVVTLQLEVAERVAAVAGQDAYGVLSLLLQARYQPKIAFVIPSACFFPIPDVDSACVILERRPTLLLDASQYRVFVKIVKRGFSQRRKMMMKLLKADWPVDQLTLAFAELCLSTQARAETVTLDQFVQLAKRLTTDLLTP